MLDRHMLALQNRILDGPAARLARLGVPADAVTIIGFSVGLASAAFLWAQAYGPALACILLNRLLDGPDGAIARAVGPTDRGAFLDIALDFIFLCHGTFWLCTCRSGSQRPGGIRVAAVVCRDGQQLSCLCRPFGEARIVLSVIPDEGHLLPWRFDQGH